MWCFADVRERSDRLSPSSAGKSSPISLYPFHFLEHFVRSSLHRLVTCRYSTCPKSPFLHIFIRSVPFCTLSPPFSPLLRPYFPSFSLPHHHFSDLRVPSVVSPRSSLPCEVPSGVPHAAINPLGRIQRVLPDDAGNRIPNRPAGLVVCTGLFAGHISVAGEAPHRENHG